MPDSLFMTPVCMSFHKFEDLGKIKMNKMERQNIYDTDWNMYTYLVYSVIYKLLILSRKDFNF